MMIYFRKPKAWWVEEKKYKHFKNYFFHLLNWGSDNFLLIFLLQLIEDDSIDKLEQVQIKIDNFLDVFKEKIIESSIDCDIDKVYDEMKEFMTMFYDVQTLLINSRNGTNIFIKYLKINN